MKGHVERLWEDFRRGCLVEAPDVQVREMRRAFYMGASALLSGMGSLLSPDDEATDADLAVMQAVHDEIEEFLAAMLRGEA